MISILTGKVVQVLPTQSGVSKSSGNAWELRSFIIETNEKYPKKIHVETLRALDFNVGDDVRLGVEIESREFNGKWYTSVRIIGKVDENNKLIPQTAPSSSPAQSEDKALLEDAAQANQQEGNDLPF